MTWSEVRKAYPDQWLITEAIEAHTEGNQRLLDYIAVIETCVDGAGAMQLTLKDNSKSKSAAWTTGCTALSTTGYVCNVPPR